MKGRARVNENKKKINVSKTSVIVYKGDNCDSVWMDKCWLNVLLCYGVGYSYLRKTKRAPSSKIGVMVIRPQGIRSYTKHDKLSRQMVTFLCSKPAETMVTEKHKY